MAGQAQAVEDVGVDFNGGGVVDRVQDAYVQQVGECSPVCGAALHELCGVVEGECGQQGFGVGRGEGERVLIGLSECVALGFGE